MNGERIKCQCRITWVWNECPDPCPKDATQEDLLCDHCRDRCSKLIDELGYTNVKVCGE